MFTCIVDVFIHSPIQQTYIGHLLCGRSYVGKCGDIKINKINLIEININKN